MAILDVEVESDARAYRVFIDQQAVTLSNGAGKSADLSPGEYRMTWDIIGSAGDYLSIEVRHGSDVVAKVDKSVIPSGEGVAHGITGITVSKS